MNFLFTYVSMSTGGIETLILRMTDWLIKKHHNVDILLISKSGELLNKINAQANVISLGNYPELSFLLKYWGNQYISTYDVIYSFSPLTTWTSLLIGNRMNKQPVILNGVYHIYDYEIFANDYTRKVFKNKLPDDCKIFMTPLVKREHEKILERKMDKALIWPLPISSSKFVGIVRTPQKYRIVSIGRLEGFKTYNILMLDVIKKFVDRNVNISYYIYGDGQMATAIKRRVGELSLEKNVVLCGTIDYDEITTVLSDAFAFVGMGTSAIEAGLCRVPSLVAIAYANSPISHGFIHQLPDYNSGEFIKDSPCYDLYDRLELMFRLNDDEYQQLCEKTFQTLKGLYDIDYLMDVLLKKIENIREEEIIYTRIKIPYYFIACQTLRHLRNNTKNIFKQLIINLKMLSF